MHMKILRHNGQKVLEAFIHFDNAFVFEERLIIELTTVDRGAKYMLSFTKPDIEELTEIFEDLDGVVT